MNKHKKSIRLVDLKSQATLVDRREDGKQTYDVEYFGDGSIDTLTLEAQSNTRDEYKGVMCSPFWLLCPAGRPVHKHIETASLIDRNQDGEIECTTLVGKRTLNLTLDPQHDYIPRMVKYSASSDSWMEVVVTEYRRAGDWWFPTKGRLTRQTRANSEIPSKTASFEVTDLKLNVPIAEDLFLGPVHEAGMIVKNRMLGTTIYVGGIDARNKAEERERSRSIDNVASKAAVHGGVARFGSWITWWLVILGASSAAALAARTLIKARKRGL